MATTYKAPGVYVEEVPAAAPITGVGTSTAAFIGVWPDPWPDTAAVDPDKTMFSTTMTKPAKLGDIVPCTSFTDFKQAFGDFSAFNTAQNQLAHAVRGFFDNGGTFCYVARAKTEGDIDATVLAKFEAYDDVAMVVAPGVPADVTNPAAITAIVTHCTKMGDRIAIFDAPASVVNPVSDLKPLLPGGATAGTTALYPTTDFAAVYTPWLNVYDAATGGTKTVPPSGHIAGIYARTDATRGVWKAPANEPVLGAINPSVQIGKAQQAEVNLIGGNCIRVLNGAMKVWGARTLAGDSSLHKYVPIRRFLSFLYKSIDEGTQWAVFEPNGPDLWARIIRNVGSFLTSMWAQGALAGDVAQEAFYIKCDAENNPPDQRANGLLVVEVGVATVFPAEFVVFRIQQYTGPIK
jgi:phage tail sheath protein FI